LLPAAAAAVLFVLLQDLSSYPDATWSGFSHNTGLHPNEPRWGKTLTCKADSASYAALDPVPYAASGAFAVSIWFKITPRGSSSSSDAGSSSSSSLAGGYRHLLSHGMAGSSGSVYEQNNQVGF
jgi:hypothetical protein